MNAFHKGDPDQPVHDRHAEAKPIVEQQIDRATAPKDQLQRHRAHKRWHDQGQHAQGLDQQGTTKLEAHRQVSQRHRDDRGKHHRRQRHAQAVKKCLAQQALIKEIAEMPQRQRTGFGHKRGVNHQAHWPQQKDQ